MSTEFPVNPTRIDPYKNFKFRVKWDNQYVAAVSKVSGLKRTTEVVKHRDGGDESSSRKSPGRTEYEPITLERGVTQDVVFEQWANKVWDYQNAQAPADQRTMEVSLADFRKEIIIDVFNEAGQKVLSYQVYRCWVSEYQALPDLDANANAVAIQHIKLENEGWIRDTTVTELPEPSFTDPAS
jgi:phage tail-like protein